MPMNKLDQHWLREGARDETEFQQFLTRRAAGEPVHRILGWREFWGMKFFLSPETLEPRPDSETMIEVLLKCHPGRASPEASGDPGSPENTETFSFLGSRLGANSWLGRDNMKILDLGTGTGCLLLAALKEFPNATGIGIDQSADAVATAQKNARENNLSERAEFEQFDWNDTGKLKSLGAFDVILCNPPYIPSGDIQNLQTEVREHDPRAALDGGADGLAPYRHIAPQLKYLLKPGGIALFEFGHDQATAVQNIMQAQNLIISAAYQDLGGNDRVITVSKA